MLLLQIRAAIQQLGVHYKIPSAITWLECGFEEHLAKKGVAFTWPRITKIFYCAERSY